MNHRLNQSFKSRRPPRPSATDLREMYDVIDEDYLAEKKEAEKEKEKAAKLTPPMTLTLNSYSDDSYDIFSGQRDADNLLKILFTPTQSKDGDAADGRCHLTVTGAETETGRRRSSARGRLSSLWPAAATSPTKVLR